VKRNLLRICLLTAFGALLLADVQAQFSAYLPVAGRTEVTVSHTVVSFDSFWAGTRRLDTRATLGSSGKDQTTTLLTIERGLSARWAADLTVGHTRAKLDAFPSDEGRADTVVGLRYQISDELESFNRTLPTLTLRLGGIIAGDYDEGLPFSAGDGASGADFSLLFGRSLNRWVTLLGDVGYRWRDGAPEELLGSAGVAVTCGQWVFSTAWRYEGSVSGLDIFGPGFGTAGGFPQTKERNSTLQAGVGFPVGDQLYLQVYGALTLNGRNTGDKRIAGLAASMGF